MAKGRGAAKRKAYRESSCRKCGATVLVLLNNKTGNYAAIDEFPEPGGNIIVNFGAGTYQIVPPQDLHLFDATISLGEDAHPNLHVNHHVNCTTEIRAARAKANQIELPIDGEVAHHRRGRPRCLVCERPLSIPEMASGATTHESC